MIRPEDPQQLILPFFFPPGYTFDNFVQCDGNREAYLATDAFARNQSRGVLFLYGDHGTGKTHLYRAAQNLFNQQGHQGKCLYLSCHNDSSRFLSDASLQLNPGDHSLLICEDLEFLHTMTDGETRLFNLFNQMILADQTILLSADRHPRDLTPVHERLISRFLSGTVVRIGHLDEETCAAIIRKLARDERMQIPEHVIAYLIRRAPRHPESLRSLFKEINTRSLQLKKPISIPLVKQIVHDESEEETTIDTKD